MPYATQQDIIDRYGSDTLHIAADRDNDGVLDTAAITRALDDATAEINVYVGARYDLPLSTVPTVLVKLCVDIALYQLATGTAGTDERRQRYEDAVALLKRIATGELQLGMDAGTSDDNAAEVELIGPGRMFNRNNMGGLI